MQRGMNLLVLLGMFRRGRILQGSYLSSDPVLLFLDVIALAYPLGILENLIKDNCEITPKNKITFPNRVLLMSHTGNDSSEGFPNTPVTCSLHTVGGQGHVKQLVASTIGKPR